MKEITKKKAAALILVSVLTLTGVTGCASNDSSTEAVNSSQNIDITDIAAVEIDQVPDYTEATSIILGGSIQVNGPGAAAEGSTVNITEGGSYTISGTLSNGMIDVNTRDKVNIELNQAAVTNSSGPALMITDAKKVILTLRRGTANSLADSVSDSENDGAVFTNDTLVINGEGALEVAGNNQEGISSDDDIIINSGTIRVKSVDDGLNAHNDITINGGYLYVVSNGDGIDSNGTLNINGGTVIAQGSITGGDGGVDSTGIFALRGGTLIATGNSFASPSRTSAQASLYLRSGTNQSAGTLFHIAENGNEILTFAPERSYQNVLYSSDKLRADQVYEAEFGGSSSGTLAADGIYSGGAYAPGTNAAVTATAAITPKA